MSTERTIEGMTMLARLFIRSVRERGVWALERACGAPIFRTRSSVTSQMCGCKAQQVGVAMTRREYSASGGRETVSDDHEEEYYVDVSNIESRWAGLGFDAQQDIISYLNVKQEFGWEYLSKDEKRAIYYIAYGKWGPRDPAVMSSAEFVFKLMTNMLLFSVLGFSLLNYAIDQEKIAEFNGAEESTSE